MIDRKTVRDNILETLRNLSSKELQIEYQKNVPIADVPSELLCSWFDDNYFPNEKIFIESFSIDELKILKDFNNFLSLHEKKLPDTDDIKLWHVNSSWISICEEAKKTFNFICKNDL